MPLSEEQAKSYMLKLLGAMTRAGGSDLFVSKDFPPSMKIQGKMQPLATQKLTAEVTRELAHAQHIEAACNQRLLDRRGVGQVREANCRAQIGKEGEVLANGEQSRPLRLLVRRQALPLRSTDRTCIAAVAGSHRADATVGAASLLPRMATLTAFCRNPSG